MVRWKLQELQPDYQPAAGFVQSVCQIQGQQVRDQVSWAANKRTKQFDNPNWPMC